MHLKEKNGKACIPRFISVVRISPSLVPFPSSSELVSSAPGKVQKLLTENLTNKYSFHKRVQSDISSFKDFLLLTFIFLLFFNLYLSFSQSQDTVVGLTVFMCSNSFGLRAWTFPTGKQLVLQMIVLCHGSGFALG